MQYRPELDGVRAIAVMAVLLFHADETLLGGGYVGVDVFFALSGYLITEIISRHMEEGKFSFVEFYARRIRRLVPALLPVVVFSSAVAGTLFLSDRLKEFVTSLVGVFTYSSNYVFLAEVDYFDDASATKLLLHTWSLAVEEQFYLVFPAILFVLKPGTVRWRAKLATAILALLSFAAAVIAIEMGAGAEAFFASPLRFWEMLFGSLLALTSFQVESGRGSRFFRLLGLALMLAPMVFYTPATKFPGLTALPPVVGTILIIAAGPTHDDSVLRTLSHPVMTYLGKISYSLYLWHWPMLVASKFVVPQFEWVPYASLVFSVGASILSYHTLEIPLRRGTFLRGMRRPYAFLAGTSLLVLLTSAFVWKRVESATPDWGFYFDWNRTKQEWRHECRKPLRAISPVACADADSSRPTIMLIGDSQAQHLLPGIKSRWPNTNLTVLAAGGCKPVRGYVKDKANCKELRTQLFKKFNRWDDVDLVIISVRQHESATVLGVADTARWIAKKDIPVWLISGYLEHNPSLNDLTAQHPGISSTDLHHLAQKARRKRAFTIVDQVRDTTPPGVRFIDARRIFCRGGTCATFVDDGPTKAPINANGFHLSTAGSKWFVNQLPQIEFE